MSSVHDSAHNHLFCHVFCSPPSATKKLQARSRWKLRFEMCSKGCRSKTCCETKVWEFCSPQCRQTRIPCLRNEEVNITVNELCPICEPGYLGVAGVQPAFFKSIETRICRCHDGDGKKCTRHYPVKQLLLGHRRDSGHLDDGAREQFLRYEECQMTFSKKVGLSMHRCHVGDHNSAAAARRPKSAISSTQDWPSPKIDSFQPKDRHECDVSVI